MRKMLIPVTIAILIAFVLISVFFKSESPSFEDKCAEIDRIPERNVCYVDLASELKTTDPCDYVENNNNLRNSCYAKVSINSVNRL